jgi:hypothetical protein
MNERKLQEQIVEELNASAELAAGGAKAFVEDQLALIDLVSEHLLCGVALVVVTPDMTRSGSSADGIPATGPVLVQCEEVRDHKRERSGNLTALAAGRIVRHLLDRPGLHWRTTSQRVDPAAGRIIVTVTFDTGLLLTPES